MIWGGVRVNGTVDDGVIGMNDAYIWFLFIVEQMYLVLDGSRIQGIWCLYVYTTSKSFYVVISEVAPVPVAVPVAAIAHFALHESAICLDLRQIHKKEHYWCM